MRINYVGVMDHLFILFGVLFVFNQIEFTLQSLDEKFLCTETYCQNYLEVHGCPGVELPCRVQNSTHNGRLFPSPTPCNCCQFCLEHQKQGEWCTIGMPGSPLPNKICGPGLTCTIHNGKHPTCEPMSKTKCFRNQRDFDERKEKGDTGDIEPRPKCNGDGLFEPIVCVPGQTCYCVNEEGERIFGEAVETDDIEFRMKCECARLAHIARELIDEKYPVMTARCDSMGSFDSLQCMNGTCFCADPIGTLMSTEIANITEGVRKLPCYNSKTIQRNMTSMEEYLRPCETELMEQIELKFGQNKGVHVVDFKLQECNPDGRYPPVRENKTAKYCADEEGNKIDNYEALKEDATQMNCKCARARKLLIDAKALEIPDCNHLGNYLPINCRRGVCYCIDENGLQSSAEERPDQISKLWCCQNNKCEL